MTNTKTGKARPTGPSPISAEEDINSLQKYLQKTKMCSFHKVGKCRAGSSCAFAHVETELHITPDLHKTQLCAAFQRGYCDQADCPYAHGESELRDSEFFFKRMPCKFYALGKCHNGKACRFAHGSKELHSPPPDSFQGKVAKKELEDASLSTMENAGMEMADKGLNNAFLAVMKGLSQQTPALAQRRPQQASSAAGRIGLWSEEETDSSWNLLPNLQTNLLDIQGALEPGFPTNDIRGSSLSEALTPGLQQPKDPMKIALPVNWGVSEQLLSEQFFHSTPPSCSPAAQVIMPPGLEETSLSKSGASELLQQLSQFGYPVTNSLMLGLSHPAFVPKQDARTVWSF